MSQRPFDYYRAIGLSRDNSSLRVRATGCTHRLEWAQADLETCQAQHPHLIWKLQGADCSCGHCWENLDTTPAKRGALFS